jgi:hypothetical protein
MEITRPCHNYEELTSCDMENTYIQFISHFSTPSKNLECPSVLFIYFLLFLTIWLKRS